MPSTTALAPLFLTANLSPAMPLMYISPLVAPYSETLPMMMFSLGMISDFVDGLMIIFPPEIGCWASPFCPIGSLV